MMHSLWGPLQCCQNGCLARFHFIRRLKYFCSNFCIRAVKARVSSHLEEDKPYTDLQDKALKSPGVAVPSFVAGLHAQSVDDGWGKAGRTSEYISMNVFSFIVWTLVKIDFLL